MSENRNKHWVGIKGGSVTTASQPNAPQGLQKAKGFEKAADAEKYKRVLREILKLIK